MNITPLTKISSGDLSLSIKISSDGLNDVVSGDVELGRHLSLIDYFVMIGEKRCPVKGPCATKKTVQPVELE